MRRWLIMIWACWLLWTPTRGAGEESCMVCHRDITVEYEASVHADEFSCTACHGGNPQATDLRQAHAVDAGYIGTPDRASIPALCASCHADPNRMKPYGLPTDQYAQYQTSQHGRLLARGDTRAAVCTDCHATHRILSPLEPSSTVSRRNISATCGRCHSAQDMMAAYDLPADQAEKFQRGVHSTALLVEEHPVAPTCATCHGNHGAVLPQVGDIAKVCGHCHTQTRKYFAEGPHGRAMEKGEMSECITCHGYHDIAKPDAALFDTTCHVCHAQGSTALLTGEKIKTLLKRARESLTTATAELTRVEKSFPQARRYRSRLQQARAYFIQALPVQHALAVDRVEDLTRNARSIGEEVRAAIHGVEEERQLRYIGLTLVWIFILFTVVVLALYRRAVRRQRERPE
jgi:hypothetical protein